MTHSRAGKVACNPNDAEATPVVLATPSLLSMVKVIFSPQARAGSENVTFTIDKRDGVVKTTGVTSASLGLHATFPAREWVIKQLD